MLKPSCAKGHPFHGGSSVNSDMILSDGQQHHKPNANQSSKSSFLSHFNQSGRFPKSCNHSKENFCKLSNSTSTSRSKMCHGDRRRCWIQKANLPLSVADSMANQSYTIPSGRFKKELCYLGIFLAVFSVTSSCMGVAACQQPIGSPNNEIIGESLDNVLGNGGTGVSGGSSNSNGLEGQPGTDNSNNDNLNSGSEGNANSNSNGGEISGSTPFGSGGSLPSTNRNEKQPGLLCPDIYPVSTL